jgi:hypothetical protein
LASGQAHRIAVGGEFWRIKVAVAVDPGHREIVAGIAICRHCEEQGDEAILV